MPPSTQEVLDGLADLQTAAMPPGWRGILMSAHAEIERLTRERDLWKMRAEQAQAILQAHEQSHDKH